jgi:hypothetical protein
VNKGESAGEGDAIVRIYMLAILVVVLMGAFVLWLHKHEWQAKMRLPRGFVGSENALTRKVWHAVTPTLGCFFETPKQLNGKTVDISIC